MLLMTTGLDHLTSDIPGTGGVIKQRPEDFVVHEEALYEPSGCGEHLYLYVEKRQRTTTHALRRLAKIFHVKRSDIGYAGLKDKQAITRQHFSIYLPDRTNEERYLARLEHTPLTLLWTSRHDNKLRRGHLSGNRFVIHIRDVEPSAVIYAKQVLDRLATTGVPNFVGEQRFGYRQNNHLLGQNLLLGQWQVFLDQMLGQPRDDDPPPTGAGRKAYTRGDFEAALDVWPKQLRHDRQALDALRQGLSARDAVLSVDRQQLDFCVSSFQSAVFNQVLDGRLQVGLVNCLVDGDLAWKHDNRELFCVDQATADLENGPGGRVASLAVSPSGPMWGVEMLRPSGKPLRWEREALHDHGLTEQNLAGHEHAVARGGRRPLRAEIRDPEVSSGVDEHGPYIRVAFFLPRGSYATVVLREVTKSQLMGGRVNQDQGNGAELDP